MWLVVGCEQPPPQLAAHVTAGGWWRAQGTSQCNIIDCQSSSGTNTPVPASISNQDERFQNFASEISFSQKTVCRKVLLLFAKEKNRTVSMMIVWSTFGAQFLHRIVNHPVSSPMVQKSNTIWRNCEPKLMYSR